MDPRKRALLIKWTQCSTVEQRLDIIEEVLTLVRAGEPVERATELMILAEDMVQALLRFPLRDFA